jgi:hypothetical protein
MDVAYRHFVLRDLPLAPRLVIAAFLLSAGIGYCSALVNVHFEHAPAGKPLPSAQDTADLYHGRPGMSPLERLVVTDESKPFSGSGTMRQAFTSMSAGWKGAISRRAREKGVARPQAEAGLRQERDGEVLALVDWIRTGARKETFEGNNHSLPQSLSRHAVTADFITRKPDGTVTVRVGALFAERCTRCHQEHAENAGGRYPLQTWDQVHNYCEAETGPTGMSLKKLARSTHVHLLGLATLYGLTGLVFAFTSYPGWLRGLIGPLPLVAQLADIGCWWLARLDPAFGPAIVVLGAVVAASLGLQIVMGLFNLFGRRGQVLLLFLFLAAGAGAWVLKEQVIDAYLAAEGGGAQVVE